MNTWIHLCVNNDHGFSTGKLYGLEILGAGAEIILELESVFFPEPAILCKRLASSRIKLHERIFPIQRYATWVGNICWDAIQVDLQTAEHIINYLATLRLKDGEQMLSASSGHTRIFNAYQAARPIHLARFPRPIYSSADKADYQYTK